MTSSKIAWTKTDEAPALATYAFLPIVQAMFFIYPVAMERRSDYLSCTD